MKLLTTAAAALFLALLSGPVCQAQDTATAQQSPPRTATWNEPEFGDISEIANLTKVYVYCEDLKIRQEIVDELRKEPALQIVGRIDDAEILINYTYQAVTWSRDRGIFGTSTKTARHDGDLLVVIGGSVDDQNRVHQRIVWSVAKDRKRSLGKDPYIKGARAFLEDYRRARLAVNAPFPQPRRTETEAKPDKKEKKWYESDKP